MNTIVFICYTRIIVFKNQNKPTEFIDNLKNRLLSTTLRNFAICDTLYV